LIARAVRASTERGRGKVSIPVTIQQFVILSRDEAPDGGMAPIGSRADIVRDLSNLNTSPEKDGDLILWGPGIRIELPPDEDPVRQMLVTMIEEEIAWQVIVRLAKAMKWKILDPLTGRELSP